MKDMTASRNDLELVDDQGRVQTQLKRPCWNGHRSGGGQPGRIAAGRVSGLGPRRRHSRCTTLIRANHGRPRTGKSAHAWTLVFSPDGTRVATGGEDGVTRLWDTSTGTMTAQCRGHTRKVISVAFRPDGQRLATSLGGWDRTAVGFRDGPGGRAALRSSHRRGHDGEVQLRRAWIASGGTDRTVRVWGAANRQDLGVLQGHTGDVRDLAFTSGRPPAGFSEPDADGSASLEQQDGTVRLWEVGRQGAASVLRGHISYVYPVAYSPDGQWIASGGWDNKVRLWDALTGESIAILPHPGISARWPLARTARGWSPDAM